MTPRTVVLVVAKAPVPGHAKTRLTPPASPVQAAEIAAASLLDTVDNVGAMSNVTEVVAWTGDITSAVRNAEIVAALSGLAVVPQRGTGLGERLSAAHVDAGRVAGSAPVLQIGMDTPQVTPDLLWGSAEPLHGLTGADAVLGIATDGGWWALGVRDPRYAAVLCDVPMSRSDTGFQTLRALRRSGLRVELLPELSDVDTMADAWQVADHVPESRFAAAVQHVTASAGSPS